MGQPLLDAGDAGTVSKAGAKTGHHRIGEIQQGDGLHKGRKCNANGEEDHACKAGELGTLLVVEEAADEVAEYEGKDHVGGDHGGGAGNAGSGSFIQSHGVSGNNVALERAPQVQDAHAQLNHKACHNGNPGVTFLVQFIQSFSYKITGQSRHLRHRSGNAGLPLAFNFDIIPWFEENVQGVGENEMISVRVA